MLLGAVSFMLGKIIFGVVFIQFNHFMVPQHFRDDGGHGDLGDEGVAVDNSDYWTSEYLVDAKSFVSVNTEF
jgi:hypothetical protein